MSAHFRSSGPRSNAYSESRFTNWTEFDPFFAEVRAAFKRFDARIPRNPASSHVIALRPQIQDFTHPCTREEVVARLECVPHLTQGLRAVFLLAGTRKQQKSWSSSLGCYGMYWRSCIFLFAYPFNFKGYSIENLRQFFLDDVLVHELAHHIDRHRQKDDQTKEAYAYAYVERQQALKTKPARKKLWGNR